VTFSVVVEHTYEKRNNPVPMKRHLQFTVTENNEKECLNTLSAQAMLQIRGGGKDTIINPGDID
jgi:hypothetical protein